MFNKLEELEQLAIDASTPYTGTHMVHAGIKIVKNFDDSEKGLTSWFDRTFLQHTLQHFKKYFER